MDRMGSSPHWLVDVARRNGLANADSLSLDAALPAAEAWERAAAHVGMSLEQLAQEVAEALHLPLARLDRRDAHVGKLVPEKIARRFNVMPLRESDRQIVVATADPLNEEIEGAIGFASGRTPLCS